MVFSKKYWNNYVLTAGSAFLSKEDRKIYHGSLSVLGEINIMN
jgi:hypothetical protein